MEAAIHDFVTNPPDISEWGEIGASKEAIQELAASDARHNIKRPMLSLYEHLCGKKKIPDVSDRIGFVREMLELAFRNNQGKLPQANKTLDDIISFCTQYPNLPPRPRGR